MNSWREECAVFGIWGDPEASRMTYLGLYAQQHRGQESTGIVSLNNSQHIHHKGLGLVHDDDRVALRPGVLLQDAPQPP